MDRFKKCTVACVIVSAVLTGCTKPPAAAPSPEKRSTTEWLEQNTTVLTHQWYADRPDIDLESPEIQVARAYLESYATYLASGDTEFAYPGFSQTYYPQTTKAAPRTGTSRYHVLESRPLESKPTTTRVFVCLDDTQIAYPFGNRWQIGATGGFRVLGIARDKDATNTAVLLDPTHRIGYPTWDVFDGWTIDDDAPLDLDDAGLQYECNKFEHADPSSEPRQIRETPPPVDPPIPGWPTQIDTTTDQPN